MSGLCPDLVLQWLMVHEVFDVLQGCRSNVCQCLACEKAWCEVTMTLLKDSSRARVSSSMILSDWSS